jgi:NADH-quinone oxidoreductase subunit C
MADDPQKPPAELPTPPSAAADKPAGAAPGEPLKAEVSRTDAPGAGVSAAPVAPPRSEPPAPKPDNPEGAVTATTSETSSATGEVTPASPATPAAAAPTPPEGSAPAGPAAAKPAAPSAVKPAVSAAAKPAAPAAAKPAPPAAARPAAAAKPGAPAGEAHVPKAAAPVGPPDPPPPAGATPPAFIATLQTAIPGSVSLVSYWVGDWTIIVPVAKLLDIARHLRDAPDAAFDICSDVTATDWPLRPERFDMVYCLYSTRHHHRIRVKARVAEHEAVPSATGVWPAANWLEREVYDMFGVNITGHPDRRRILMPEDWQGFPQRKDYPLEGPGELLMENPQDWLRLRQAREQADIE